MGSAGRTANTAPGNLAENTTATRTGTIVAGVLWAALMFLGAAAAQSGDPAWTVIFVASAFAPYGVLLWRQDEPSGALLTLAIAAVGAVWVWSPPILSDDLYRYLWDAKVLWETGDPYHYAPSDGALAALRDEHWRRINNPGIATIYPPVAQGLFLLAERVVHAPEALKALALLGHGLITGLMFRRHRRAALAFGLNPMALVESAGSGHIDVFVGLAVLLCAWALESKRPLWAAVAAAMAGGIKLVGLMVAPLMFRRHRLAALLTFAIVLLFLIPLAGAGKGSDSVGGAGQYARRWRGNEGAYAVVQGGVEVLLEQVGEVPREGRVRFDALRPIFEGLEDGLFDPRASLIAEKKPIADVAEFEVHVLGGFLSRALVAVLVLVLALGLGFAERMRWTDRLRWVLLAVLLLAPQLHPWYLLWILPLGLYAERRVELVWSAVILVAYVPLSGWLHGRIWAESDVGVALEHLLVWSVLGMELWRTRQSRPKAPRPALGD